jgi:hypothetical protein
MQPGPDVLSTPLAHAEPHPSGKTVVLFCVLGLLLLSYVALCTSNRDNSWGADAWEHHRVIVALTRDLWHPGNPTYATSDPSIRYSPYSVLLAVMCRRTGLDPYGALSIAAVFNTALMLIGLWTLLRAYGVQGGAPHVLLVMVGLYGVAPGYANSYALADLPWHQVNPSALVFALGLLMWTGLRRSAEQHRAWGTIALLSLAGAVGMLSHAHTAIFVFLVMGCVAATVPQGLRARTIRRLAVISVAALLLCVAWPWFSFIQAVRSNHDSAYWFNPFILKITYLEWCAPALLLAPLTLSLRRYEVVRLCLLGAAMCYGLGMAAFVAESSLLARLPLPGLFLLQLPIGLYIGEHQLFRPSTWLQILRDVRAIDLRVSAPAYAGMLTLVLLVSCAVPQVVAIPRDPLLARAYVAPLLGKQDKQLRLRSTFAGLLEPVDDRDVVLSDVVTSWPVPSIRGRVVAGLHYEAFSPDQFDRDRSVRDFFTTRDDEAREDILDRYGVRWILLNAANLDEATYERLLEPQAVVKRANTLVLMDAHRWRELRGRTHVQRPAVQGQARARTNR